MSFLDQIPAHERSLKTKIADVQVEIAVINVDLGNQDQVEEFADHDCDCEFCPSQEVKNIPLLDNEERAELEKKRTKLEALLTEYEHTLKSLDAYAKLWTKKEPVAA